MVNRIRTKGQTMIHKTLHKKLNNDFVISFKYENDKIMYGCINGNGI
jgi:hypothetical protein